MRKGNTIELIYYRVKENKQNQSSVPLSLYFDLVIFIIANFPSRMLRVIFRGAERNSHYCPFFVPHLARATQLTEQ